MNSSVSALTAEPIWIARLANLVRSRALHRQPEAAESRAILGEIVGAWHMPTSQQGGWWDVEAWREGLAGSVLAGSVDNIANGLAFSGCRAWITREHVFSFVGAPVDLFVAAMAWGYGLSGYGWYRTRQMFGDDGGTQIPALVDALRAVALSPERTWDVLTGNQGIRGLGPAFGTKLAYFAGYDRVRGCGPLIADRWTAWAFWALAGDWDIRGSARLYGRYADIAREWATQLGWHTDDVERALFVAGPQVLRTWRKLKSEVPRVAVGGTVGVEQLR